MKRLTEIRSARGARGATMAPLQVLVLLGFCAWQGGCVVDVASGKDAGTSGTSGGTGTTGSSGTTAGPAAGASGASGTSGGTTGTTGATGTTGTSGTAGTTGTSGATGTTSGATGTTSGASGTTSGASGTTPPGDGGPPSGAWSDATGNLVGQQSECGNLSVTAAKPDEDLLIASVSLLGLWGSKNGGGSWTQLGTGTGSAMITNRGSGIIFDPAHSTTFWEVGIYNGLGVYRTDDDGMTFKALGTEQPGDLVSIDFTDPLRQTMVAGGHEMSQLLNLSTNGGSTWAPIGSTLPPNTNCTNPLVLDSQTFLVGCGGYGGGVTGVWRTTNQGMTWASMTTSGGAKAPLLASDGTIYWSSASGNGMTRSMDKGVTWTDVGSGDVNPVPPTELPDGRIVAVGPQTLMISSDKGKTWKAASTTLPYSDANGVTYSKQEKAFFVWHFTCGNPPLPVPAGAIMRYPFDYQSQ